MGFFFLWCDALIRKRGGTCSH